MEHYHEKILTENDVKTIQKERTKEIAINAVRNGLSLELIRKITTKYRKNNRTEDGNSMRMPATE